MKTIGYLAILLIIQTYYYSIKTEDVVANQVTLMDVIEYLVDFGYLESLNCTKLELRRSLRQVQKEHSIRVNGKITPDVKNLVQKEKDKTIVINYLKTFGYLRGEINPIVLNKAIKLLQRNSGELNITGSIDTSTLNFIKSHPQGYLETILE